MIKTVYDINLFFELFQQNKYVLIFAYGAFDYYSKRKLLNLPDNTSFMMYGQEWQKVGTQIKKV